MTFTDALLYACKNCYKGKYRHGYTVYIFASPEFRHNLNNRWKVNGNFALQQAMNFQKRNSPTLSLTSELDGNV
jgi:hypothetical protein